MKRTINGHLTSFIEFYGSISPCTTVTKRNGVSNAVTRWRGGATLGSLERRFGKKFIEATYEGGLNIVG